MIMAAHQPNFFPWLGFFNKIHMADVFVILDDVQMVKTGSTWFNRSYFLMNGEARFFTVSVSRPSGTVLIKDAKIIDEKWSKRFLSTLESAYRRHPFYDENIGSIIQLIDSSSNDLCSLNKSVINHFVTIFDLKKTSIRYSSDLSIETASTQRLIDISKRVGCDAYLEGGGATGYQEDSLFHSQGVSLIKQNFVHPSYPQKGSPQFVMGLSVLDALFNCGIDETKKLIIAGVQ